VGETRLALVPARRGLRAAELPSSAELPVPGRSPRPSGAARGATNARARRLEPALEMRHWLLSTRCLHPAVGRRPQRRWRGTAVSRGAGQGLGAVELSCQHPPTGWDGASRTWPHGESPSPIFLQQDGAQWRRDALLPSPAKPSFPPHPAPLSPCLLPAGAARPQGGGAGSPPGGRPSSRLRGEASLPHLCFEVAMVTAER